MSYKTAYCLFCLIYSFKRWLARRFTVTGIAILCCLLISGIVGIDTKLTMAYQIFSFLCSILLIAIGFSWPFPGRFNVTRILPRFGTVGVKFQYPITIENHTSKIQRGLKISENFADIRPSWLEFRDEIVPEKNRFTSLTYLYYRWTKLLSRRWKAKGKTVEIGTVTARGKTKVLMEIEPKMRGIVQLTGVTVARPDPFGLFNACKTVALQQSLLILPRRYQVPLIELPGARKAQSGNTSLASSVGDSEEFISLRDYRPGDPLRKIHWKSWAKTDKPIVREEQEEFFVRHALILDTFASVEYSEVLEEAVSVAASFACDFQTQESLLDLMFVADEAYCFTNGRGLGNTEQMLEILAGVTSCRDKSFDRLTSTVMNRVSLLSGCILILIDWNEERKSLIRYLQMFNIPTLVLVVTEKKEIINEFDLGKIYCLEVGKIQEGLTLISKK